MGNQEDGGPGGGDYFVINRARQYGKTTTLKALGRFLIHDYTVMSLDFQVMSASNNQVFLDFPVDMSFSAGDIEGIWNGLQYRNGCERDCRFNL